VKTLDILIVEAFYTGSHKRWAEDICELSSHRVKVISLPGRHWKWRMHGGAISLAAQYLKDEFVADVIFCTDMIDVALFKSQASRKIKNTPILLYFHENQISYPWSKDDPDLALRRDNHYGFINYSSALAADQVIFNSQYHLDSFCNGLNDFLHQFPDFRNLDTIEQIRIKSSVIPIGIKHFNVTNPIKSEDARGQNPKTILWNHRWEYDKNPSLFFETLFELKKEGIHFSLIVAGESTSKHPVIFKKAQELLSSEIIHFGFASDKLAYYRLLEQADILPVTSNQDFFGISVIEAIACQTLPLLPDRLAYPDHIPDEYKTVVMYQHDHEFKSRLRTLLTEALPQINYAWILQYQWEKVIQEYDQLFSQYE